MLCCAIVILSAFIVLRALINAWPTIVQLIKSIISENVDLKQRYGDWAVITGATDGIGKAYAEELARRQINLVLIGRNQAKLTDVATDFKGRHGISVKTIVADFAQGRGIYGELKQKLEPISAGILINNVGVQYEYPMPISELPENEIWDNVHVNVTSAVMMTRILLPKMLSNNKGAIVNISSNAAHQPHPYMNLYAASKTYLSYFSDALREEVKSSNLTVQTLEPLYVSSKINHFVEDLRKIDTFIPDVNTYAYYAVNTLGKIDRATGYWPHTIQAFWVSLIPIWYRSRVVGKIYRSYGRNYLRNLAANKNK